jgi:hypothetical protein
LKKAGGTIAINCSISTEEEAQFYTECIDGKKLDELVARFPVKHSGLPHAVARALEAVSK